MFSFASALNAEDDQGVERIGAVVVEEEDVESLISVVYDSEQGYAYFGTGHSASPGRVYMVAMGDKRTPPRLVGSVALEPGEEYLRSAAIDPEKRQIFFGTDALPGRVVKLTLGEGEELPQRVGSIELESGENRLLSAVFDPVSRQLLFGTQTRPGLVVQVDPGERDELPARVGALEVLANENFLWNAAIDPGRGYAYFATGDDLTPYGRIVMVGLPRGDQPLRRSGRYLMGEWERWTNHLDVDAVNGYLYFAVPRNTQPALIYKLRLGEPGDPPVHVDTLTLEGGRETMWSGYVPILDAENGYLYYFSISHAIRVAVGEGDEPMERLGAQELPEYDGVFRSGLIDPANEAAYFGLSNGEGGLGSVSKYALTGKPHEPILHVNIPGVDRTVPFRTSSFNFRGTAESENSEIEIVQWRYEGEAWRTAAGRESWSFNATNLQVGENIIEVRARNIHNMESPIVSRTITREEEPPSFTVHYIAEEGGTIGGHETQVLYLGETGTWVTALPDEGHEFVEWSDGLTESQRRETNVQEDITLVAHFALVVTNTVVMDGILGRGAVSAPLDLSGDGVVDAADIVHALGGVDSK